ncbi:MAG: hypothetical protein ABJD13_03770 [Paracoccaceae bacterium]
MILLGVFVSTKRVIFGGVVRWFKNDRFCHMTFGMGFLGTHKEKCDVCSVTLLTRKKGQVIGYEKTAARYLNFIQVCATRRRVKSLST